MPPGVVAWSGRHMLCPQPAAVMCEMIYLMMKMQLWSMRHWAVLMANKHQPHTEYPNNML